MFGGGGGFPNNGGAGGNPFNMMFPPGGGNGPNQPGLDPFQMLFGGGGGIGAHGHGGAVDPEQLFGAMFGGGMPGAFGGQPQQHESPKGPPATSAAAIRSLPRIKVTAYDIAANESPECSICLDELVMGQPALRIPCGHLFHEDCVKDWLKKSNECPVCRLELPSDDKEHERGRHSRMAGRKLRMRQSDLTVKTAQELRRLADFIGVDVKGCLEKSELVDKIAASERVHIIPVDEASGGSLSSAQTPVFMQSQLDSLSIQEVKSLTERLGIDHSGCSEKADILQRLTSSGRIIVAAEPPVCEAVRGDAGASTPGCQEDVFMGDSTEAPPRGISLVGKSVGDLRKLAKQLNVSLDGCLEKADILERIQAAPGFREA